MGPQAYHNPVRRLLVRGISLPFTKHQLKYVMSFKLIIMLIKYHILGTEFDVKAINRVLFYDFARIICH